MIPTTKLFYLILRKIGNYAKDFKRYCMWTFKTPKKDLTLIMHRKNFL